MKTRPLGQSGLCVSPIGVGLAALGRPGYINLGHANDLEGNYDVAAMERRAHAVLDAAWEAGVRYFDAARSYGRAEAFLGSWLQARGIPSEAVTVGSKWGYTYTAGWKVEAERHEVKDHTLPVLRRQVAESRSLLGEYLDLYQIHSATLESGVLENHEVLHELAGLRETGLRIGLSLSGARQSETLARAMDAVVGGRQVFGCVQATWNLLEPSAGERLREAHESGWGVIVKEALANGRLTARNDDPEFAARRRLLDQAASDAGTSIDALALAAALAQPWVDVVLSGAATVEQLQSNLAAPAVTWTEELSSRLEVLREDPQSYWAKRGEMAWN